MTSPKNALLSMILCLGIGSLFATPPDHTSALQPNEPGNNLTITAPQEGPASGDGSSGK